MQRRKKAKKRKVQRQVKDRLFRFLFEKDKEALLQLYNAKSRFPCRRRSASYSITGNRTRRKNRY